MRIVRRPVPERVEWQLTQQGVSPLCARLFAARGVTSAAELAYEASALLPPQALMGARQAAMLLADALAANARLLIVADYDCDGATACAVGLRALRALIQAGESQATVDYLVPDRFVLGYGLSPAIVTLAAQRFQPDLILTVDNGIASLEGVAAARKLGIATLVTDHHLPALKDGAPCLPDADCIVNPNQPGCDFPSKSLAGVGVIYYVMLALRAELRERGWFRGRPEPNLGNLLDLVALGTVADVVRLDHNNRILVSQGLRRIRAGHLCCGLRALLAAAGREAQRLSVFDLGFVLGPRINAAGRLADMGIGIECLLAEEPARALALAQKLDALNRERREIETGMQEQALAILDRLDLAAAAPAGMALFEPEWHEGVVGLLASRVKDRLHRPVFAFAPSGSGELKGSGRSIPGLHLRDALDLMSKRAPGLLLRFGGHAAAAGVTVRREDFPLFRDLFADIADELLPPEALARQLETDGSLESGYCNLATTHLLESHVWGQGFAAPVFDDTFTIEWQRILKEKHLKLRLRKEAFSIDAIQFNFTTTPAQSAHIAYRLGINNYKGIESPQLLIEHLA
ncbi:MAG: single-stranded-DNA-specific exonuclease RecJ [Zoogloeaceae bacterium]|jgi:single-stranded-DNA-specific exonuclease|nr:single-stranded-DNA-specific exonuclease RecJ [Zoogloeaceae bacterium]